jgi:hypothetical protein
MEFNLSAKALRAFDKIKRLPVRSKIKLAVIVAALFIALIPLPSELIEQIYSNGVYPIIRQVISPVVNWFPFALVDALIIAAVVGLPAWWITGIVKAGRGNRKKAAARLLFNTIVIAAIAFLIFELLWGLNYARKPLTAKLDYDEERLTPEAMKQLKRLAVERADGEYIEARMNWPDDALWRERLYSSFDSVVKQLGNSRSIEPVEPKRSLFDFYLTMAGIEAFVNPFGYEVIMDSEILAFEKPFLLAHEWAHIAGFADESEASFVGLLACLRSELAAVRYSGWLALYQYTPWPVSGTPAEIKEALLADPPPRPSMEVMADLQMIRERAIKHRNSLISRAQWMIYDSFLRANRVQSGIRSYGRVIRLMAGTRFESEWNPVHRE